MAAAYKSDDAGIARRSGTPAQQRELRPQGRRTMQRLLDAGLEIFSTRGYHATRVDDVVRAARTSHGTFYLYFANKEDLLHALALDCAQQLTDLSTQIGPIDAGEEGFAELRRFLAAFLEVYRRYGPVIRAWMEGQVGDPDIDRLGVKAFAAIRDELGARMRGDAVEHEEIAVVALVALIERFSYVIASRRIVGDDDTMLDTVTRIVQRGFFGGAAPSRA